MPQPSLNKIRSSFDYLRSVCRDFNERLVLGDAIRNGWTADGIAHEAGTYKGSRKGRHLVAIYNASRRRYYSPEQRAADQAALQALNAAEEARDAIKATKATRPVVPIDYKAVRAACRSMLDCDRLSWAVNEGWRAADIALIARQLSNVASHKPNRETPASYRSALSWIEGKPAGHCPPFLLSTANL
jgi:hypothetical protein